MGLSKDAREMRFLIEAAKNAISKKTPTFRPKARNVTVWTVLGKFMEYDEVYEYAENILGLVISDKIEHGNYRFGYINEAGMFVVFYIGRADNGLLTRMQQHWYDYTNNQEFDKYKNQPIYFSFREKGSELESYQCECEEYHRFDDGLKGEGDFLNTYHPAIPNNSKEHCPVCGEPK